MQCTDGPLFCKYYTSLHSFSYFNLNLACLISGDVFERFNVFYAFSFVFVFYLFVFSFVFVVFFLGGWGVGGVFFFGGVVFFLQFLHMQFENINCSKLLTMILNFASSTNLRMETLVAVFNALLKKEIQHLIFSISIHKSVYIHVHITVKNN